MAAGQIAIALAVLIATAAVARIASATETAPVGDTGAAVPPNVTADDGPMVAPVKRMKPQMPDSKAKPASKSAAESPDNPTANSGAKKRR